MGAQAVDSDTGVFTEQALHAGGLDSQEFCQFVELIGVCTSASSMS